MKTKDAEKILSTMNYLCYCAQFYSDEVKKDITKAVNELSKAYSTSIQKIQERKQNEN